METDQKLSAAVKPPGPAHAPAWLIATDLDGTLLDDSYPHAAAAAAIDEIQADGAGPCVALASSKTLAEMTELAQLVRTGVFIIFENGSGVAWPRSMLDKAGDLRHGKYEVVSFAGDYASICRTLSRLRDDGFAFRGFADMDAAEVAQATGLSEQQAALARQRLASEPIAWLGSEPELERFKRALGRAGLSVVRGGRFLHVSRGGSKAMAVEYLCQQLTRVYGSAPRVLACGDAPNDLEMIDAADMGLVFPGRSGGYLKPLSQCIAHATKPGPESWLAAVKQITEDKP